MASFFVEESAVIPASPKAVYGVIADYKNGHPKILPKKYFLYLEVEKGGFGNGTRFRSAMRLLGRTHEFRATVSEPEPGRVLLESDMAGKVFTSFIVDPLAEGKAARVTFRTEIPQAPGIKGLIEKFLARRLLRRVYREELALLSDFCRQG